MTKEELAKKFTTDKLLLETNLKDKKRLNRKYKLVRKAIDFALIIEGIIPFMFSGALSFYSFKAIGITPFITDKVEFTTNVNTGIDSKIVYSNGWENNSGEYRRVESIYEINQNLLKEDIISMSKEELEKYFVKIDERIIRKKVLSSDDHIYDESLAKIITYKDENLIVNFISTDLFLVVLYILGLKTKKLNKLLFQEHVKNSLIHLKYKYTQLDEDEIKNILSIKEENLSLLGLNEKHK